MNESPKKDNIARVTFTRRSTTTETESGSDYLIFVTCLLAGAAVGTLIGFAVGSQVGAAIGAVVGLGLGAGTGSFLVEKKAE